MSDALPVIQNEVECEPYKLKLSHASCVENYNASTYHTGDPARWKDKCRHCGVGSVRKIEAKQWARGDDRVTTSANAKAARAREEARERSAKYLEEGRERAGVATISTHRRADIEVATRTSRPPAIPAPRSSPTIAESMARVVRDVNLKKLVAREVSNEKESEPMERKENATKPCPVCEREVKRLEKTPAGPMCKGCKKTEGEKAARVQTSAKKPAPKVKTPASAKKARAPRRVDHNTIGEWIMLKAAVREVQKRHEQEIAQAVSDVIAFERKNPHAREEATRMLEDVVAAGESS